MVWTNESLYQLLRLGSCSWKWAPTTNPCIVHTTSKSTNSIKNCYLLFQYRFGLQNVRMFVCWIVFISGDSYGSIWDLTGPYRTILDHKGWYETKWDCMGPYGPKLDHTRPYRTVRDQKGPYEGILDHTDLNRTIRYHRRPEGTIQDHTGPYGSILDCLAKNLKKRDWVSDWGKTWLLERLSPLKIWVWHCSFFVPG